MLDAAFARIVAAAWHASLGVPPASLDEDFFAAGGHSLVATELSVRLSQVLGLEVPLTVVFDCPTVRAQTAWLAANVPARAGESEPWPADDSRVVAVIGETTPEALAAAELPGAAIADFSELRDRARREAWQQVAAPAIARFGPAKHLIAFAEPPPLEAWHVRAIAPGIARVLASVAHQQSTDLDAALAALVAGVLARGGERIAIGVRAGQAVAPVALDTGGDPSFVTLVDRARDAWIEALAACSGLAAPPDAPIAALVELRRFEPHTSARGLGWRSIDRPTPVADRPHVVATLARSGRLVLRASTAALADRLEQLLTKLAAQPTIALSRLLPDEGRAPAPVVEARPEAAAFPLTHAQERLWFLEALTPGTATNHIQRVYRVAGPLDHALFERALRAVAARHPSLRTTFQHAGGSVQQIVHPSLAIEHRVDRDGDATELALADHAQPFDLERGPLWRTRLVVVGPREHVLIFTIHHLVVDALSVIVWLREVAEHYHAFATQGVPRLAQLGTSVAEIAAAERTPAGRARGEADLAFWLERLGGVRPLDLPLDFRRPRGHSPGRHEAHELWSPERAAELRALGRRRRATLNVTLFAAAAAFLARLTGQLDLVCVVPAARRENPGREAMIGLLLNLLPVRISLDGDPSFVEIITRANVAVRGAIAHAESPYERIVAGLGLPREPGRQPLLDVIVNMVPGTETTRRADLQFTIEASSHSAQPCDLVVGATTRPGGFLDLMIRGRDDLFAEVTVQRMMQRFVTLLGAAIAAPTLPLSELPILPDDERELSTVTWNASELALPEATVHELVGAQLARVPDAIAVAQGDRTVTAGELDARSRRLADHLGALGIARGTHVGVAVPPSPELAIAALGVMRAGAVYVPLDRDAARARDGVVAFTVDERVLAASEHAAPRAPVACTPDDPAYVVFTSGSTGRPKTVATSHRALVNQIAWFHTALPWQPGEVSCLRSSPAFVDSLWELFGPLADGVPLAIATKDEMRDARLLAAMIARHRVTRMIVVPSLIRTLLALGELSPSLTLWLATSEELAPALVRAFRAARPRDRLINLYGASETADQVAAYDVIEPDPLRTPIGAPVANSRLYVVDSSNALVPIGVEGELCVAGVGVAGSDAPEARYGHVAGERVYRTGDRGRWRYDGALEYLGRFDHVLKIRGVRVDPAEVETALLELPELSAAVVTAAPGLAGEARLVAHVVAGSRIDPAELRRRLRSRLPEPLIPTSFIEMDALPLGPTGKIDRAALPASPPLAPVASRAPSGATEHAVALAWEHVLGRPVGAEDDFFSAGGESLLAALLGARLAERFGVEPPLSVLFERPTIAAQSAWIEEATRLAGETQIPRLPPGEPAPLSFAQERLWFAMQLAPDAPAPKLRSALRIEGLLDVDRLERALVAVAERQAALRVVIADGKQRVLPRVPRDHEDVDLTGELDVDAHVHTHLDDERVRPFDLSRGPLWRTRLLRFGPELHVLVITMHHLITDGISLGVWRDELHEHYASSEPELAPLVANSVDVAAWQRRAAGSEVSRRFWQTTLAGAPALELPVIAPRTAWSAGASGRVRADLDEATADALAALGRAEDTTIFGALLAGAAAWLRELTGQTDLVIGTIAGGRDRPEVRPLVGLFLNPLPLRVDASGDPSPRELVRRAGKVARAALAHGEVPFERIVAETNPPRRPFRQPLFDVVLNHHPIADPPRLGELVVRHVRGVTAPVAPYELMIRTIARHGLTVQLDFQRERFAEATVAAWLARYVEVLRAMVS